jgi:flavin reductase (DIM6/NTAB) family NADH-FMN oxidoreductase RutF
MHTNESRSEFDPRDLRRAFGRFGTGVTVVTTRCFDGQRVGVTANSFNTVSLEPPIVLWSLAIRSPNLENFRQAGRFVVNVLARSQVELSQRFSRPAPDKFAGVAHHEGLGGLPVLEGCVAAIECVTLNSHAVGDHVLFLGRVEAYTYADAEPLLFCNGQYLETKALPALPAASACSH